MKKNDVAISWVRLASMRATDNYIYLILLNINVKNVESFIANNTGMNNSISWFIKSHIQALQDQLRENPELIKDKEFLYKSIELF